MNKRIAYVRKISGLTQESFANRIGLTKNYISLLETGNRAPSDRTIADICREFRINDAWLRSGEGKMDDTCKAALLAKSTINERFRQLRKVIGLSQKAFASGAHRTRSEIKNIEYGKTTPKEEVILSVCCAYNVSEIWLRSGNGEMFNPIKQNLEITAFTDQAMYSKHYHAFNQLIAVLARLDVSELELLEQLALKLAAKSKKEDQA